MNVFFSKSEEPLKENNSTLWRSEAVCLLLFSSFFEQHRFFSMLWFVRNDATVRLLATRAAYS